MPRVTKQDVMIYNKFVWLLFDGAGRFVSPMPGSWSIKQVSKAAENIFDPLDPWQAFLHRMPGFNDLNDIHYQTPVATCCSEIAGPIDLGRGMDDDMDEDEELDQLLNEFSSTDHEVEN